MTLAGEGGEPAAHCGEGEVEERGGQRRGGLGGVQQVAGGAWGEGGGLGVLEGEEVRGVCALGAAREGRAPQGAAVEAYTRGGDGWWGGCARGSLLGVGSGRGLQHAEEVRPGAAGVGRAGVSGGEQGCPSDGWEVGSAGGGESVRPGESVVPAGAGEHGAADCSA